MVDVASLAEHPGAYWKKFIVCSEDLDGFNHVNNAVYLKWLDATVWEHTKAVGLSDVVCMEMGRGMAAVRHEIDYLASAQLGDEIVVFNWVAVNDGRLRATRLFQMARIGDRKTILRAKTDYISTNLTTGRPTRMPDIFKTAYAVTRPM
ncbi:MAG: thioesterase family protein [Pelagimonas sp.]|jgi:acyl-CoA thioester hydrolase|nr:thioesterase family protein [Pelagimonas sp.]